MEIFLPRWNEFQILESIYVPQKTYTFAILNKWHFPSVKSYNVITSLTKTSFFPQWYGPCSNN